MTTRYEFPLTRNNFHEGGRKRDPLEVCLNANGHHLDLPKRLEALSDDGAWINLHISGTGSNGVPKNVRGSRDGFALGKWLFRQRAVPGDTVVLWTAEGAGYHLALEPGTGLPAEAREAAREERRVEDELCAELEAAGVPYQRQAALPERIGVADVLTPDTLYEVKPRLNRASVCAGTGQLLLYRAGVPDVRTVLVGRAAPETPDVLAAFRKGLEALGVEVRVWGAQP